MKFFNILLSFYFFNGWQLYSKVCLNQRHLSSFGLSFLNALCVDTFCNISSRGGNSLSKYD